MKQQSKVIQLIKNTLMSISIAAGLFVATVSYAQPINFSGNVAVAGDYAAVPPVLEDSVDPFVMINLSVELTQQAEAYTGRHDGCYDRVSGNDVCYNPSREYIGYYDPNKCYVYDTSGSNAVRTQSPSGINNAATPHFFKPSGATNASHECSGKWSGNFLNWSTMTALDEFRAAMVGGARLVDTKTKTLLVRAHRYGDWSFVNKKITKTFSTAERNAFNETVKPTGVDPATVTPFSAADTLIVKNNTGHNGPRFTITATGPGSYSFTGEYNSIVEVCNASAGLETNCTEYDDGGTKIYKPEGVLQRNALNMRFALTTYSGEDGTARDGGVLRSNAKYIGYLEPATSGGLQVNTAAEVDQFGRFVDDPEGLAGSASYIRNSGLINYINMFGLPSADCTTKCYKSNDPVAELFYEGLRYIKALGNTPEYSSGLSAASYDNFPVINNWVDPVQGECQANTMLAIGDQFAHADDDLPGTSVGSSPSNPDTDINVDTLTDAVGTNQGFHAGTLGSKTRGRSNNGWYVAGLAWYANTTDIRTGSQGTKDFPGKQTVKTYVVDTQEYNTNPPMRHENPLWLAAKYGGFNDINGDGVPHANGTEVQNDEWDADRDNDPDTYVLASEPANLVAGLNQIFNDINERISSGAAAAVVANSSSGVGAVYQALYEPRFTNGADQINWGGVLQAVFIDEQGRLREDTNLNDTLDTSDDEVRVYFDTTTNAARFTTHDSVTGVQKGDHPLQDLKTVWNARDQLAAISNAAAQRIYTANASSAGGRFIKTWIDANNDGIVDSGEYIDFTAANFPTPSSSEHNARYLGFDSSSGNAGEDLVNYIRGEEISGLRSRTIDYDNDGVDEVWRLGDLIHSAPVVVGRPGTRYDLSQNDNTYAAFRNQYANRRQVVYVGGNDGMLHAFNGGFYNPTTSKFQTTASSTPTAAELASAHALGDELWAYVPMNLLPHLKWLSETDYPHVYYVDGAPKTFDVNIFPDDATHPKGWGTILVVGMRFGGGEITVNTTGSSGGNKTFRSSYMIFDITDPEQEPVLIAEINDSELGYTLGNPTVVKARTPSVSGSFANPATNKWVLLFGSGPAGTDPTTKAQALKLGQSSQNARVYGYDLNNRALLTLGASSEKELTLSGETNSFVGGFTAVDWDNDYVDDVVYFGTVGGAIASPTGNLKRLVLPSDMDIKPTATVNNLVSGAAQPFSSAPSYSSDIRGNRWVYAGTGRHLVDDDNLSAVQQSFYGVIEPTASSFTATISKASLADTSGLVVKTDGTVETAGGGSPVIGGSTVTNFNELKNAVEGEGGWYFDLQSASTRNVTNSILVGESVVFTEYEPSGLQCEPEGQGFLNAVHLQTGTAAPYAALGSVSTVANKHIVLGKGNPSAPVLHVGTGGGSGVKKTVLTTSSTAVIQGSIIGGGGAASGRRAWKEIALPD